MAKGKAAKKPARKVVQVEIETTLSNVDVKSGMQAALAGYVDWKVIQVQVNKVP